MTSPPTTSPPTTRHHVRPANPTAGTATLVTPEPESRLDQLAAEHDAAKAAAADAAARLKTITDGIKAELSAAAPGETEVVLASPHLTASLQLQAVQSWRLDSTALKKAHPRTWVEFAKRSTSWTLRALGG